MPTELCIPTWKHIGIGDFGRGVRRGLLPKNKQRFKMSNLLEQGVHRTGGKAMFVIGIISSLILVLHHLGRLWLLLKSKNPRTGGNR